jgi:hypothetical protein
MHEPREQGGCSQGRENKSEGSFHRFSPLTKTDEFPYPNVPFLLEPVDPFPPCPSEHVAPPVSHRKTE